MKMNTSKQSYKVAAVLATGLLTAFVNFGQGATVTVTVPNGQLTFSPSSLTIHVGDTVTWVGLNNIHNVTGSSSQDLKDFCGASLSSFAPESSCSHTFTNAGTFPYECTIHAAFGMLGTITVAASVTPPTVSITNPAGGAVFSAPATLKIAATAAASGGTVTNVAFFAGTTRLGSAQAPPFQITSSALAAGDYSLTAVATAAGNSSTSSVVNISVITPAAVSNSAPVVAHGQFSFTYNADVGLTYLVQRSFNLTNWSSISTNAASSNPVNFTDKTPLSGAAYYRAVRLPNP